jgi:hypothetical protein
VKWTLPSENATPVLGFALDRLVAGEEGFTSLKAFGVGILEYTDTIQFNTEVKYRISCYNWVGVSPYSNEVIVTINTLADAGLSTSTVPAAATALVPY